MLRRAVASAFFLLRKKENIGAHPWDAYRIHRWSIQAERPDRQKQAPGERGNLNRGPSVPRGSWGRKGTPPTIIKQRGAEPRWLCTPAPLPEVSPPLGRRTSAIATMKLRLG